MRTNTVRKITESEAGESGIPKYEYAFMRARAARKALMPVRHADMTSQDYIEQMESRHWEMLGDFA